MASKAKAAKWRDTKETSPVHGKKGQRKTSTSKKQLQSVVAVFPDTKNGNRAYEALQIAVKDLMQTQLDRVAFEKLDYGETASLDKFYAANVAVVDVTERHMQAALFYQLGLRENFEMKNNVVTFLESQSSLYETGITNGTGAASMVSSLILFHRAEQRCTCIDILCCMQQHATPRPNITARSIVIATHTIASTSIHLPLNKTHDRLLYIYTSIVHCGMCF